MRIPSEWDLPAGWDSVDYQPLLDLSLIHI